jgi:hypothetical protein
VGSHSAAATEHRPYVIRPQPQAAETRQYLANEDELGVDHWRGQLNKQHKSP